MALGLRSGLAFGLGSGLGCGLGSGLGCGLRLLLVLLALFLLLQLMRSYRKKASPDKSEEFIVEASHTVWHKYHLLQ